MSYLRLKRTALAALLLAMLGCLHAPMALAQSEDDDSADEIDTPASTRLTEADAKRILAEPLPEARDARYLALQRQIRAAAFLEDRVRQIALYKPLLEYVGSMPGAENWIVPYVNAEFTWGSSGAAAQACEAYITDTRLSLGTRAVVALRQTYFVAQGHDRGVLMRDWERAESLTKQAIKQGVAPSTIEINRLQIRSELERWDGDRDAAIKTLREAVRVARRNLAAVRAKASDERAPEVLDAYVWLDGTQGMLGYALTRGGRPQEATSIAQDNLALWRAGKLSDSLGARWNYRLANSLNAVQQFEPALAAARLSDEMLQRAGSNPASHTRWMARQQIVRALLGLERWKEADTSYREFLAAMPNDLLARTRASDTRLLVLLAAKNGRYDDALKLVERSIRNRTRLYGADNPETQEMMGMRGVVHLLRGDISSAMGDYENLFKATLDTPGGWLDLDIRGVRGFVFGIAFNEFMRYVAERAQKGQTLEANILDRALQIADRNAVGVTQRALTDSTARVLAASPALRALLEQEQNQRRVDTDLATELSPLLAQEDQIRRDMQTPEYKALKADERKPTEEKLQQLRDQIKAQQAKMVAARAQLANRREEIAKQFPSYADLVTPTLPRRDQLRALLSPGEALLVIYPTDRATLVWLVNANGKDGFAANKLLAPDIDKRVAELRSMLDLGSAPDDAEPPLKTERLYALYNDLLGPLQAQLGSVQSLLVASNGALASLPFAALVMQPPTANGAPDWLVQHMAVTQIPSPSSLLALRRVAKPNVATKAMMGFGDPLFKVQATALALNKLPPAERARLLLAKPVRTEDTRYDAALGLRYADIPPLPETRKELQAVANALGANQKTDLVLGDKATRAAVLAAPLSDRRLVAFATHGLMPGELPGVSKPALAMAATANEDESPLLELDDVLGLRLNAQWVLLSACNTAAGVQNDAAMSGLVRGFFFAGARSVLATHWAVESDSAAALSASTFANAGKSGTPRGESLRQAQLAMLDGRLGDGKWKHPYYWAAYALFGDPLR